MRLGGNQPAADRVESVGVAPLGRVGRHQAIERQVGALRRDVEHPFPGVDGGCDVAVEGPHVAEAQVGRHDGGIQIDGRQEPAGGLGAVRTLERLQPSWCSRNARITS